jgi:hypothetical protein
MGHLVYILVSTVLSYHTPRQHALTCCHHRRGTVDGSDCLTALFIKCVLWQALAKWAVKQVAVDEAAEE